MDGTEAAAVWGFAGVMMTALVGQIGAYWLRRRQVRLKKANDTEVVLENKDNRAWKFLWDQLNELRALHAQCQQHNEDLGKLVATLGNNCRLAVFSMNVLKNVMLDQGLKIPPLPQIDGS